MRGEGWLSAVVRPDTSSRVNQRQSGGDQFRDANGSPTTCKWLGKRLRRLHDIETVRKLLQPAGRLWMMMKFSSPK